MLRASLASAGCLVVSFVTLGLPGAFFLLLAAGLFWWDPGRASDLGDGTWGAAILSSFAASLAVVPAHLLARRMTRGRGWLAYTACWALGVLLAGTAVAAAFLTTN